MEDICDTVFRKPVLYWEKKRERVATTLVCRATLSPSLFFTMDIRSDLCQ